MKKLISLLLCAVLVACVGVVASADTAVTLSVADAKGQVGDVIAVDVLISEGSDLGALEVSLSYDIVLLKPVTKDGVWFAAGEASTEAGATIACSRGTHPIKLAAATSGGYTKGGVVASVYFEIMGDVGEGTDILLECTYTEHVDDAAVKYTVTTQKGTVTMGQEEPKPVTVLYGDINQDGKITADDALAALKTAVNKLVLTDEQTTAGNVNNDQKVDAADALLILKKVVDKIDKFPVEE